MLVRLKKLRDMMWWRMCRPLRDTMCWETRHSIERKNIPRDIPWRIEHSMWHSIEERTFYVTFHIILWHKWHSIEKRTLCVTFHGIPQTFFMSQGPSLGFVTLDYNPNSIFWPRPSPSSLLGLFMGNLGVLISYMISENLWRVMVIVILKNIT